MHVEGFVPGTHCTSCDVKGILTVLPPVAQRFGDFLFTCPLCIGEMREWKHRSDIAKKAVHTKRNKYPKWPCNRKTRVQREEERLAMLKKVRDTSLTFFWEKDTIGPDTYRWWRSDSPGDMFDMIDGAELARRISGASMCRIRVVDHLPGFCPLREKCPDHEGIR